MQQRLNLRPAVIISRMALAISAGLGCEAPGADRMAVADGAVTNPADPNGPSTPNDSMIPGQWNPGDSDGGATNPGPMPMNPAPGSCATAPGQDADGDGFPVESDCNDCSAQVNPGAFDAPGDGVDADCDGSDASLDGCDDALPMAPTAAEEAARAIGLCRFIQPSDSGWGVLEAKFTNALGSDEPSSMLQVGLLPSFGSNTPPQGANMLALSSGIARAPNQPNFTSECDTFGDLLDLGLPFPRGVPSSSPSCRGFGGGLGGFDPQLYDSVALEVTIRVPSNATGYHFNSNFFTYEYPHYVCADFNDFFAVLQQRQAGDFENIVYDDDGNLVSVNNSLLRACAPGQHGGKSFDCPEGRDPLMGTGYDGTAACGAEDFDFPGLEEDAGGATGWLRTIAPAQGGEELTLRFAIWDTGDSILDSLVLIDGFTWETDPIENTTPQTDPDPLI